MGDFEDEGEEEEEEEEMDTTGGEVDEIVNWCSSAFLWIYICVQIADSNVACLGEAKTPEENL